MNKENTYVVENFIDKFKVFNSLWTSVSDDHDLPLSNIVSTTSEETCIHEWVIYRIFHENRRNRLRYLLPAPHPSISTHRQSVATKSLPENTNNSEFVWCTKDRPLQICRKQSISLRLSVEREVPSLFVDSCRGRLASFNAASVDYRPT